ncbi:MAG TPA: Mur ligase family protein [Candidatus Dormibacteraeota bacterium]|nr:Mur ligase family protein [Candidatus Dormibacteraeota bacterium]
MKISNFSQARATLHQFHSTAGTTYTLDRMLSLMEYLNNPQNNLRVIHIAGTSGKTSTAYYVSALLESTGSKVGLTVSPHVDEVNERLQINHRPLSEVAFCKALSQFLQIVGQSKIHPSYFELMIAFAFWQFASQGVDYAVIEVGLGGLLDGTNIVNRTDKVCLITDIGLDHTEVLGNTLKQITTQKAGIIYPANHVFMNQQTKTVLSVIKQICAAKEAKLQIVGPSQRIAITGLPLFQQRNLSLAKKAVDYVLNRDGRPSLTNEQIQSAAEVYIPARMERIRLGKQTLIIDGAHNSQKLSVLAKSIDDLYPDQPIAALVAFVEGSASRWQSAMTELLKISQRIIVTAFQAEQDMPKKSVDPFQVQAFCQSIGFNNVTVVKDPRHALVTLKSCPQPLLLITGSFYLLNSIRPLIVKL